MSTTTELGPADVANNPYLGQTERTPRPTAETWTGGNLERRQGQWDTARAWHQQNAKLREERDARLDAERDAARARAAERQDEQAKAKQAAIERDLRARFIQAGGTEGQWAREKEGLVLEAIKRAALGEDDQARRRNASRYM